MEAFVATELFKRYGNADVCCKTLIGDDDSSTIFKIHQEVDDTVVRVSDVQHAKRTLEGQLIKIRGNHKELTHKVTKYVKKCFSYAIAQNEGDANGLAKALRAIPGHVFGDHSSCGGQWGGYLKDPENYKHKFTKGGKDLSSPALQSDLTAICENMQKSHTGCVRVAQVRETNL